ncbi:MAG: hypothetical protein P8Y02_12740 [Deinococcales bacterium]
MRAEPFAGGAGAPHRGLDLRGVAVVAGHLVGAGVLVDFGVVQRLARCAAGTGRARDDVAHGGGTEQARGRQRSQGQAGGGGVAAGTGDEAGAGQLVAVQLDQAVARLGVELGVRVLEPVPLRVGAGVEPEVGRQIDDAHAGVERLLHQSRGGAVRGGAEHHLTPLQHGLGALEAQLRVEAGELGPARLDALALYCLEPMATSSTPA